MGVVYLAMIVGPSVGAPKAKVVLGLDGLEVGVWGIREDEVGVKTNGVSESECDEGSDEEEDYVQGEDNDVDAVSSEEEDDGEDDPPPQSDDDDDETSSSSGLSSRTRSLSPPPKPSYAQTEQNLRNAERLLACTLASHEGGNGFWMADELGEASWLFLSPC